MYRSQISRPISTRRVSSRITQPKLGAWAVSTPSTNRINPYHKREISQLLKAASTMARSSRSTDEDIKPPVGNYTLRRKSSKVLSTIKARLEKDSHVFRTKMRELAPTIRSLSLEQEQISPRVKANRNPSLREKIAVPSSLAGTGKSFEKSQLGLLGVHNLDGEKLVTVGGYIISLQDVNENITSVIRPRVSSDRAGLELEIKILGCNPMDIKFERRYDTLIVIGVSKSTIRRFEDTKHPAAKDGKTKESKDNVSFSKISHHVDQEIVNGPSSYLSDHELLEDMHEIINIFVPKHAALNQIFISKPDAKGRIFVKGP